MWDTDVLPNVWILKIKKKFSLPFPQGICFLFRNSYRFKCTFFFNLQKSSNCGLNGLGRHLQFRSRKKCVCHKSKSSHADFWCYFLGIKGYPHLFSHLHQTIYILGGAPVFSTVVNSLMKTKTKNNLVSNSSLM